MPDESRTQRQPGEHDTPESAYEGRTPGDGDELQPGTRSGRGAVRPTGGGTTGDAVEPNKQKQVEHEGGGGAGERHG